MLNPVRAGFNPLFEFQHVLFYSEYGFFLNWSLMGNWVGKEYFFRPHLIFCYIKREKNNPYQRGYFSHFPVFITYHVVGKDAQRSLQYRWWLQCYNKAHTDECFVLHPGNPFWNAVAWEGQGGSRSGWVGTAGSQAPGAAALCLPYTPVSPRFLFPSSSGLLSLQGEGCCRPKWPCFPLPLHPLCSVGDQVQTVFLI